MADLRESSIGFRVISYAPIQVFLSHVSEDRELANYLGERLSESGFQVWWAEERLLPGENWARATGDALEQSDAMIVLVSPDSASSRRVREELNYALGASNYAGRVIPVVVRPTKKMPWILRKMKVLRAGKDREQLSKRVIEQLQ